MVKNLEPNVQSSLIKKMYIETIESHGEVSYEGVCKVLLKYSVGNRYLKDFGVAELAQVAYKREDNVLDILTGDSGAISMRHIRSRQSSSSFDSLMQLLDSDDSILV